MSQIQSILKSVNKQKPKIFTVFTTYAHLRMLKDFEVYYLINRGIAEPKIQDFTTNAIAVNGHQGLEFDLCFSFSGGLAGRVLKDIAKEVRVDYVTYELNYPNDLSSDIRYITENKDNFSPSLKFSEAIGANPNLLIPYVTSEFKPKVPILNRPIQACTHGEFLIEKEQETNFSDWRHIVNTLPSQIFGCNPRMGTHIPTITEFADILSNTRVYINTRTAGFYPMEILQAISCGCAVISYPYPGIEDFVPPEFVVKNKEECRAALSKLLANDSLLSFVSQYNAKQATMFNNDNHVTRCINRIWEDISESGYKHYGI